MYLNVFPMSLRIRHVVSGKMLPAQISFLRYLTPIYQTLLLFQNHIKSVDSGETNIDGAIGEQTRLLRVSYEGHACVGAHVTISVILGMAASEEFIKITLSAFEAVIQYPVLLADYRSTVSF